MNNIFTQAIRPSASITASEAGTTSVNVADFQGLAKLVLDSSALNAGTSAVKVQHSDTQGGTYEDVVGGAFANVTNAGVSHQELLINADKLKAWARVVNTLAGGANAQAYSVQIVGKKQATT